MSSDPFTTSSSSQWLLFIKFHSMWSWWLAALAAHLCLLTTTDERTSHALTARRSIMRMKMRMRLNKSIICIVRRPLWISNYEFYILQWTETSLEFSFLPSRISNHQFLSLSTANQSCDVSKHVIFSGGRTNIDSAIDTNFDLANLTQPLSWCRQCKLKS